MAPIMSRLMALAVSSCLFSFIVAIKRCIEREREKPGVLMDCYLIDNDDDDDDDAGAMLGYLFELLIVCIKTRPDPLIV